MKDKILMLVIGILIGAIITTGGFLIFGKENDKAGRMGGKEFDPTVGTYATSGATFNSIVEFENDGNLKIDMTGKCTLTMI